MRYERIRTHGMGVLGDFELDLTKFGDARLIGLVGPNGCGKSTLLGLMHGSVFRNVPTRGSIVDMAQGRDAFVEVTVVNGSRWVLRQSADAISKKSEMLILAEDGTPAISSTKVRDGDEWVAQHFPSEEVVLASLFCAQQSTGFLGMKPAERKATLLSALGISKLERLAEEARERARDQKATVTTIAARLDDERSRGGAAEVLEVHLADARTASAEADARAAEARQRLADAQAQAASVGAAMDAYASAVRARQDLRRRRDAAAEQLRELEERAAGLRASAASEPALAEELEQVRSSLAQAEQTVRDCDAHLTKRREELAEARRQAAALADLEGQRAALQGRRDAATAKLADIEARIRNNEAVLAERPAIEAAVAELARLQEEEQAARRDAAEADAAAKLADLQVEEARRACDTHQALALQERERAARLREALAQAEEIERAAACLPGLERDVAAAAKDLERVEAELEGLRGRRVAGADERIEGLRWGLEGVLAAAHHEEDPLKIAAKALADDDIALAEAQAIPEAITHAAARVTRSRERLDRAKEAARGAAELAALAGRLVEDRKALAEAERADLEATEKGEEAERDRASASQKSASNRGARDGYLERAAALAAQAELLRPMAAKAVPLANAESLLAERRPAAEAARAEVAALGRELEELSARVAAAPRPDVERAEMDVGWAEAAVPKAQAERNTAAKAVPIVERLLAEARGAAARLAELEPQVERERAALATLDQELAAGADPVEPPPPVDVAAVEREAQSADESARRAAQAVAVAEQQLEQARAAAGRLAELGAELATAESDLGDWNRLAADLGRDGLQAAIVDSAIPELNEHTNTLLHEAFGPRFTVDLRTQRLDAKGKRDIESMDVIVIDTERGREAPAETLSGGERVIVQEALSLGLTALACRSAGLSDVSLVRDETGAALDPERAAQYVRMLRRAADLIGARHILFVSHNPDVQELADARVELGAPS